MTFFKRAKKIKDQPKPDQAQKVETPKTVDEPVAPKTEDEKKPARKKKATPKSKQSVEKATTVTGVKRTPLISKELDLSGVLLRPRITEKATIAAQQGVYVFEVSPRATKHSIKRAVKKLYKVDPVRINIVKIPSKKRVSGRTRIIGVKSGGKKAYVFLKNGDHIEFV